MLQLIFLGYLWSSGSCCADCLWTDILLRMTFTASPARTPFSCREFSMILDDSSGVGRFPFSGRWKNHHLQETSAEYLIRPNSWVMFTNISDYIPSSLDQSSIRSLNTGSKEHLEDPLFFLWHRCFIYFPMFFNGFSMAFRRETIKRAMGFRSTFVSGWCWLEHEWIIFPTNLGNFIEFHSPNWRTHIFQRSFVNHQPGVICLIVSRRCRI